MRGVYTPTFPGAARVLVDTWLAGHARWSGSETRVRLHVARPAGERRVILVEHMPSDPACAAPGD